MTKRRLTEREQAYDQKRSELIARCKPEYIADAPFLFANRIQTASMPSRVELLKMVMDIRGASGRNVCRLRTNRAISSQGPIPSPNDCE